MTNPCARRDGVFAERLGSETILYDKANHKAHSLNQTVALIWEQADGQKSIDDLAVILGDELAVPVDTSVVLLGLEELNKAGLMEQPVEVEPTVQIPSRRDLVSKFALAGVSAALVPLVASVLAPTPAMASSVITPQQAAEDLVKVTSEALDNPSYYGSKQAQKDLTNAGIDFAHGDHSQEVTDLDGVINILGLPPL